VLDVDRAARTIAGLVVPYGRTARFGRRDFRFAPGWASHGRVYLLHDHDHAQRLGRAVTLAETPDGLHALFQLCTGPIADRALLLAAAGAIGPSPGVDYSAGTVVSDPEFPGARLVVAAWLTEVSLTADTAFDWR
jgi:phage head maturation protease